MAARQNDNLLVNWYWFLLMFDACCGVSIINGSLVLCKDCPVKCSCKISVSDVIVNCSGRHLDTIPEQIPLDTTILLLSDNNINEISNYAFTQLRKLRHLDLSHNHVMAIHEYSFYKLSNLESLGISDIQTLSLSCKRPFRHLSRLKRLTMRRVCHMNYKCFDNAIRDLTRLEYLCVKWAEAGPLTHGFSFLKNLKILDLSKSKINVTMETFRVLSNLTLERLSIRDLLCFNKNDSFQFEPIALSALTFLKVVDLSNNYALYPENSNYKVLDILQSFQNTTPLETLILDQTMIGATGIILPTTLKADIFAPLNDIKLKRISLQSNKISVIYPFMKYLRHLKYANVDYNDIYFAPFALKTIVDVLETRSLTEIHISNQMSGDYCELCSLDESPLFMTNTSIDKTTTSTAYNSVELQSGGLDSDVLNIRNNVERLYLKNYLSRTGYSTEPPQILDITNFTIPGFRISISHNNLTVVDASSCSLKRSNYAFKGFIFLKELNLGGNFMEYMHPKTLKLLPSLQHLWMSDNRLGVFPAENNLTEIFSDLKNLKFVELNNNALTNIPNGMFHNCPKLETVKLANNSLLSMNSLVDNLPNIRYIDLQYNQLNTFDETQIQNLEKLALNHELVLNLKGNEGFQCFCENMPFMEWFQDPSRKAKILNNATITCTLLNGSRITISEVDIPAMQLDCFRNVLIIIIVSCTCGFIVFCIVLWHHKWTLKYWLYVIKLKLKKQPAQLLIGNLNEFDVYLSCPDVDAQWSTDILRTLEEKNYNVFYPDRDFQLGGDIHEEIVRGIDASKKFMFCVNKNTAACLRQKSELRMSITRGKGYIIPVLNEVPPIDALPKVLRNLLGVGVYLEWPNDADDGNVFWKDVQRALRTKKGVCIRKNGCVMFYA